MEMSYHELKYLCETIHNEGSKKKSLIPILCALNYCHQTDTDFFTASILCPDRKKYGYTVISDSVVSDLFEIKKVKEAGGYYVNYLRYDCILDRIDKNNEHYEKIRKIRLALNKQYNDSIRTALTPILLLVYFHITMYNIKTSIELKKHLKKFNEDYVEIAHKQLRTLHQLNLIKIERCDENKRTLGYRISDY